MTAYVHPAPAIQGVIFDLDGTLGDTLPIIISAFRTAIEPYIGRTLTDAEIIATFGPSEEGTVQALAPDHAEICMNNFLACYESIHHECPEPFEGIVPLLARLKAQGMRLALVTGKGARSTAITLRRFNLETFFEYVETGSPHGPRKTEAIQQVAALWGLESSAVLYVGDAPSDVTAARKAGSPIAGAAWAATTDQELLRAQKPDAVFTTLADFEAWLMPRLAMQSEL